MGCRGTNDERRHRDRRACHRGSPAAGNLSRDLYDHPETAWEEYRSARRVAGELSDNGFSVTDRYCGLDTAFAAQIGSGDLHIALCAEYDALPGLGHACGHNLISAITVGAALALAPVVDDLGLTLTVIGTPAEEGGGGKIELLERDGFDGQHAAAMIHPGPVDVARARPFAVSHSHIEYKGKSAHAAAYPERGINAADAFTIAEVAIGLLRQQLPSSVRVHGMVTRGGEAPNAIAERTEGRWYVRAETLAELADVEPRVMRCFQAGALASGAELDRHTGVQTVCGVPHRRRTPRLLRATCDRGRSAVQLGTGHDDGAGIHRHGQRLSGAARDPSLHRYRLTARRQPSTRIRRRDNHFRSADGYRPWRARPGGHGHRCGLSIPVSVADCLPRPMSRSVRTEHDLLGDREVPSDVYYGVHTLRALENFPISGVPISVTATSWLPSRR